ncbi:AbrB family transcriptional regulator [Rhodobacter ferrooxidans]|nr:AbrB family transcriptional regulator [Rhodobacter sp. SW2]
MRRPALPIAALDLPALAITLAIGTAGGLLGWALSVPLGLMLGSLLTVGSVAALGRRPFGRQVAVPPKLRFFFVPVIGVAIGGAFTPAVLAQIPGWWASLLALCLYIPAAHLCGFWIYRRGGLDRSTAFFGSVPGGLIESVTLGEEAGADGQMLVLLQFLRLILTIVAVPLAFMALTGHAVGSASGAKMVGASVPLGWGDAAMLLAAGVGGFWGGRWLRLPAAIMTGPIIASALLHLAGGTQTVPPAWAVGATQVVIGSVLGARFAGMPPGTLVRAARLALANAAVALVLALGFALAVGPLVGQPVAAAFLAFAPGGLAEMSLIALSLQMSVVYVTAHHVARIVLSVSIARAMAGRVVR